ncbi:ribose-phosphate diphosphokinase [Haloarcula salina]|uniref:Ribose-phosphate pyrophosphokinase n=1 Tax=Haloarcula salina TaxID=1429914 RepID=A0AA41G0P5_9EURY|nr:ribose-phosphate diphosphokinase [Haloarcula salina]MBV0902255.1 ribose-phosphate diphosphokinase [Haloarcula salina]
MIIPGADTQAFAAALAEATGERLGRVEYERFPDGEHVVRVPEAVSGERAVVVASTVDSDAHVQVLQLQDAVRESGASEVVTVLPYMGYARQDEAFKPGEPISSRAMARAISTGTDRVVTVNPHEPAVCDFFDVPAAHVDAASVLADPLPDTLEDPLFLSPDEGAIGLAETVRNAAGEGETDFFEKERDYDTGDIEIRPSDAPVEGRDVVLVDDIIATGSTMSESVGVLDDRNAQRVFVTCVHPMLASNALTKLNGAGVEAVYGTDTLERAVSEVSAAPVVAEEL